MNQCKVFIRNGKFSNYPESDISLFSPMSYKQTYGYKFSALITKTELVFQRDQEVFETVHENLTTLISFKPDMNNIEKEVDELMFNLKYNLFAKVSELLDFQFTIGDFPKFECKYSSSLELSEYWFKPVLHHVNLIAINY